MAVETYKGTVKVPNNSSRPDCTAMHTGNKSKSDKVTMKSNADPFYLRRNLYED